MEKSFKYFLKAFKKAKKDYAIEKTLTNKLTLGEAAAHLGVIHWRGEIGESNTQLAKKVFNQFYYINDKYFTIAAECENPHAYNYLGMMLERGVEGPVNLVQAIQYYQKAPNDAYAQSNLADFYLRSNDLPTAMNLYTSSAKTNLYASYRL